MKNYITKVIMFILMSVAAGAVPATAEAAVKLQVPTAKVEKITNNSVTIKITKGANTKVVKKKGKKQYDKITGLQIYRRVKGGTFRKVSTIKVVKGKISKSKKYTGLKSNTFYGFRIRTYKKEGKKIYYSKWCTFGVTTKKGNSGNSGSGNSEDQKKEENVNSNKNNSTTQAGMEDCATMNERYRNYTVEEMDAIFNADYQQKTVDKVNMLRVNRGLAPYKLDATLCQLAEQRAKEEVTMQTWSTVNSSNYTHWRDTSKQRYWLTVFEDFGVTNIKPCSETVGWGVSGTGLLKEGNVYFGDYYSLNNYESIVQELWKGENYRAVYTNSWLDALHCAIDCSSHRKAFLQNSVYTDCMGVAYAWNEDKTYSVWVHIFGKYR